MASILDESPFPFHRSEAQQLHTTLTQIHPTPQAAVLLAQQAGLDAGMIDSAQAPYLVWYAILRQAGLMA